MPVSVPIPLALALAAAVLAAASALAIRSSGASPDRARRLAGPAEVKVGDLLDAAELPARPVRISGRIRCRQPLVAADGERLVAFHRDVEVAVAGRWRSVERMRETRSFDLWDHGGSVPLDPALSAEPLITIPHVWRGRVEELSDPHASAAARLVERHGPASDARAVTRSLNVTDRLLVVARPARDADGTLRLDPPRGGYLVTNLALDDAMRLLGGRHRRLAALGVVGLLVAGALAVLGAAWLIVALVA